MEFPIRINKYLAEQGIASRREADVLVAKKQVLVNGKVAVIGQLVQADDIVTTTGTPAQKRYLIYYKGRGVISHSPAPHEIDVVGKLAVDYGITGVSPVGRLDKESEGLLLVTDDGRLTAPLLSPDRGIEKEYVVEVDKPLANAFTFLMERGVSIEGYMTKPAQVQLSPKNPKRFSIIITEGKKHQIRRMCAALGYQVKTLKRVRVANLTLGNLKPNQYRKVTKPELHALQKLLGVGG